MAKKEFKLSYTAKEIEDKLGQVDNKLDASALEAALDEAFATKVLPDATVEDNGKILQVANGVWTKADAPDEDVINKIIDPDNNPLSESTETTVNCVMETGALDSTGADIESPKQIRSDFISLSSSSGAIYASVEWNEDLRIIGYDENKAFVKKIYASVGNEFSIPETWAYLRFYTSATDAQFTFVYSTPETKAEFKKVYFADHGYELYGATIDSETMHKLSIEANGKDDNPYNILELRAPRNAPSESTLCLKNSGDGARQFVDFSSMVYNADKPTVEIVCQTRGGYKLPEFSIRYNDGEGAGRVKKFTVHPDAIPMEMTAKGLKVRKNNAFDNNGAEEDFVVVNLADLADTVNTLSSDGGAVKSYIIDEARRVSDIAHKNRTSDSFVFAALADCHYGLNDETQVAINHTAQALCEIKKNISLDAIALLGDFVRGDEDDKSEVCNNMLVEVRRAFHKATENVPSFWTAGNHDNSHYYTRDDETDRTDGDTMYSYLGSNNQNMVLDPNNRHRMYGYKDFDYQKIRVIYLNTADVSDNDTTGSCKITTTQLHWLTSSGLDFSDKDDATEWGIIFLSHHPLEWSDTNTKPVISVINDYINKTGSFASVTSCAEIIAAFHGHTHNYIAHPISDGKFPSIGIPQVCFGRYNEYVKDPDKKDEFGEFMSDGVTPIYYTKTADSAQETSFNVIVIDRKMKKIYCTNYGAGKDREYNFTGDIEPSIFVAITPKLEVGRLSYKDGGTRDDTIEEIRTKDYIECEENATYMFSTNERQWRLLFYNENKTFLTNWTVDGKSYKYIRDGIYTAPANAKYMKLNCEDTGDTSNTIIIQRVS